MKVCGLKRLNGLPKITLAVRGSTPGSHDSRLRYQEQISPVIYKASETVTIGVNENSSRAQLPSRKLARPLSWDL